MLTANMCFLFFEMKGSGFVAINNFHGDRAYNPSIQGAYSLKASSV